MTQASLTAFDSADVEPEPEPEPEPGQAATDGGETADGLRCPWCGADESEFQEPEPLAGGETHDLSCGACTAVIPADADWFQNGEYIV